MHVARAACEGLAARLSQKLLELRSLVIMCSRAQTPCGGAAAGELAFVVVTVNGSSSRSGCRRSSRHPGSGSISSSSSSSINSSSSFRRDSIRRPTPYVRTTRSDRTGKSSQVSVFAPVRLKLPSRTKRFNEGPGRPSSDR